MRYWLILLIGIWSCKSQQGVGKNTVDEFAPDFTKGPPTIVYKTKRNYDDRVPIIVSGDKTVIVSYPGQEDIRRGNGLPLPLSLKKGYLLDNRGINVDVAFLKITYAEYVAMKYQPSLAEMYAMIEDDDPLVELYDCGCRKVFVDIEGQLNELIKNNDLRNICRIVKGRQ